jgi:hypothetical protein
MQNDPKPTKLMVIKILVIVICITGFNSKKFYFPRTNLIYVFCVDLRTNSDYFTVQH